MCLSVTFGARQGAEKLKQFTFGARQGAEKPKQLATTVRTSMVQDTALIEKVQRIALESVTFPVPSPEEQLALLKAIKVKSSQPKLARSLSWYLLLQIALHNSV